MDGLTRRQQEILDYIVDFAERAGYPPTRAEICEHFGFRSPNAAEDHLRALARKGALVLESGRSRGIQLPASAITRERYSLPLVGRVAAGEPILAAEQIEDQIEVSADLFAKTPDYLLRVNGDSMMKIGILDGDLLAVKKTNTAVDREIVIARVDDDVTVKRFQRIDDQTINLLPENDDYEPICVDLRHQTLSIEGHAVGVIRAALS